MVKIKSFMCPGKVVVAITAIVIVFSFQTGWSQTQSPHPMDGMSAIDIAVQASQQGLNKRPESMTLAVKTLAQSNAQIDFFRFDIVERKGRLLHEGLFPIPGYPLPGPALAVAELLGPWQLAQFSLVTADGNFITNITLDLPEGQAQGSTLYGSFLVPDQPFKVTVSGKDKDSNPFEITRSHLFVPQTVEVRFDEEFHPVSAGQVVLNGTVKNYGLEESFSLQVQDDKGFGASLNIQEIHLTEDESGDFSVMLNVPAISFGVLDILVSVTATGISNAQVENSGSTLASVERFRLMTEDSFESGEVLRD